MEIYLKYIRMPYQNLQVGVRGPNFVVNTSCSEYNFATTCFFNLNPNIFHQFNVTLLCQRNGMLPHHHNLSCDTWKCSDPGYGHSLYSLLTIYLLKTDIK